MLAGVETGLSLQRLYELLDKLSDGVTLHAPDGAILFANQTMAAAPGRAADELVGLDTFDFIHRDDVAAVSGEFFAVVAGDVGKPIQYRIPGANREWRYVESVATSYLDEPVIGAVLVASRIVDDRVRAEERMRHDELTGLPNRFDALEHLEHTRGTGVVLVDIDGFKTVNAVWGTALADQALAGIATRLRAAVGSAYLARFAGDEFLIVPVDEDPGDVALRAATAVRDFSSTAARRVRITASAGVACSSLDATPDSLLADAGTALREAKERGGESVVRFDDRLRERLQRWVELSAQLRRATAHGTFAMAFQPIVCLPTGEVHGAEALLRPGVEAAWSVGDAIKVAEDTGLIIPIGHWVLTAAVQAIAAAGRGAGLSVNVSPRQLSEPGFIDDVRATLELHAVQPKAIGFEVTETLAMYDVEAAVVALSQLRELGCPVGLDDFGTGQSSLAYLRRLPLDYVKIDRSFVEPLGRDAEARSLVEAMVAMCRALHIEVIAEGVENAEQRDVLIDAGCGFAQGYFFGRPVDTVPHRHAHECVVSSHSNQLSTDDLFD
jgi:diguanylate cyclase (GGDEF)-like protein